MQYTVVNLRCRNKDYQQEIFFWYFGLFDHLLQVEYCRQHSDIGSLCTSEYTQSYMRFLLLQFLARGIDCQFVNEQVMTAQYFVWFFCLLPLTLPWTSMKLKWKGLTCIQCGQGLNYTGSCGLYLLEFKNRNVFIQIWVAGLVFLATNTFVILR